MSRRTITDEYGQVVGWFAPEKARQYDEGERWDGSNTISLATGSQWDGERLYRTQGGRWVREHWSNRDGVQDAWCYIDEDEARDWLMRNEYETDAIETALGETLAEESGPVGRPEIGPQVKVRLPEDVLTAVDAAAEAAGVSRSAWIRDAVSAALS